MSDLNIKAGLDNNLLGHVMVSRIVKIVVRGSIRKLLQGWSSLQPLQFLQNYYFHLSINSESFSNGWNQEMIIKFPRK